MTFSIVLVSRSRPDMMWDLYTSINNTSSMKNEILVGLDSDDNTLQRYIDLFTDVDNVKLCISQRLPNLHTKINKLIEFVSGKYIFVLNDDCKLLSSDWDSYCVNILDSFGDIVYGRTYDNSIDRVNDKYAAFPIVSKIAADRLGFIMDETFGNHGSDVITYRIYEEANKVVDLPGVRIDHVLHNSTESLDKRKKDKTAVDMINRTFSDNEFSVHNLFNMNISHTSKRLAE